MALFLAGLARGQDSGGPVDRTPIGSVDPSPSAAGTGIELPPRVISTPWTVFLDSITTGGSDAPWHPLSLSGFFTEGWDEAFVPLPAGTGGGLRQGYVNSLQGTIYRAFFFTYDHEFGLPKGGTSDTGDYILALPLNRRSIVIVEVPSATAVAGIPHHRAESGLGDLILQGRFFLINSRDFDLAGALSVQIPTGPGHAFGTPSPPRPASLSGAASFGGQAVLGPQVQFWSNPIGRWVVRGGAGPQIATNRAAGIATFETNLGLGYVLNPDDKTFLSGSTLTLALNTVSSLEGPAQTYAGLTPGFRTELGHNWYLLGGLSVPLTSPRPYGAEPMLWLLKSW